MGLSDRHCAFLVAAILTPMFWAKGEEVDSGEVVVMWEDLATQVDRAIALKRAEQLAAEDDDG